MHDLDQVAPTSCCAVAIPTIPPREQMLQRAVDSVRGQEHQVDQISVAVDHEKLGAWATRQRALDAVNTQWVFFLDDDDYLKPEHTRVLLEHAAATDADYVFSYWDLAVTGDVLGNFGREFDPNQPHHTTMNILVRTELAKAVGFTAPDPGDQAGGEDWRFTLGCVARGAKIVHLPRMTWVWVHHMPGNTSGMPSNW